MQTVFFVVAIVLIVCSLYRVARRSLRPNLVPGNVLEQNRLGEQLYHRMAGHQVMAGLVRRASARVTLGIDSDPELTPLYT